MAWTDPPSYTNGQIITQTDLHVGLRDNMRELWHRLARVEFTNKVTAAAGTHVEASPLDVVSSGAITYIAAPILIVFFAPNGGRAANGTTDQAGINLRDGSTNLDRLSASVTQTTHVGPFYLTKVLTPTAASHTYKISIWATAISSSGSCYVEAGAGGAAALAPGYIEVWQRGA